MTRRHRGGRALFLALAVLALCAGVAFAERPKVAVLGLEVAGAIDQRATSVAQELTRGLRARPRSGNGPYQLAANSDRELIDEKLIKGCDDEAPKCMTEIGKGIGADLLIYGSLARTGDTLVVTLHVLDVKTKAKTKDFTVKLAVNATPDQIRAASRQAYAGLTGDVAAPTGGKLVVKANVPTGTVFVDDVEKDTLTDGATLIALAEGRYRVAVEAEGRRRKEIEVKIVDDETVTEQFDLEPEVDRPVSRGRSGVWKPMFFTTAIGAVALAAVSVYGYTSSHAEADGINASRPGCDPATADCRLTNDDCGLKGEIGDPSFDKACSRYSLHKWTFVGAAVLGVAAIGTGYMAFTGGSRKEAPRQVAVTPVVSPEGGGAMVHVSW